MSKEGFQLDGFKKNEEPHINYEDTVTGRVLDPDTAKSMAQAEDKEVDSINHYLNKHPNYKFINGETPTARRVLEYQRDVKLIDAGLTILSQLLEKRRKDPSRVILNLISYPNSDKAEEEMNLRKILDQTSYFAEDYDISLYGIIEDFSRSLPKGWQYLPEEQLKELSYSLIAKLNNALHYAKDKIILNVVGLEHANELLGNVVDTMPLRETNP